LISASSIYWVAVGKGEQNSRHVLPWYVRGKSNLEAKKTKAKAKESESLDALHRTGSIADPRDRGEKEKRKIKKNIPRHRNTRKVSGNKKTKLKVREWGPSTEAGGR